MPKIPSVPSSSLTVVLIIWACIWPLLLLPDYEPVATILAAGSLVLVLVLLACRQGMTRPWLINGLLLFYLGLSLVAYFLSPIPDFSLRRLTALFAGATGYGLLLIWQKGDPGRSQLLASVLAIAGGVFSLLVLFTIEWPSRYLIDLQPFSAEIPHLDAGFYFNSNVIGGVMLLLLPFALALFLEIKTRTRFIYLVSAFSMILIFIVSQSRNAYLSAIFAVAAGFLWGRIRFRYVFAVLILLVILPFAVVWIVDSPDLQGAELVSAADVWSKRGSSSPQSWMTRVEIWEEAIHYIGDYPAVGAGLYTFAPISRANYVFKVIHPHFDISHTHNMFLQAGASLGWTGWIVTAGLWIAVMAGLWRSSETYPLPNRWLPRALTATIAGYLVFNSFDIITLEQRVGIFVWLVLALASGVINESRLSKRWTRWFLLVPLAFFAVLLISPVLSTNLARLQIDQARFNQTELPSSKDIEATLEHDNRRLAMLHYLRGDESQALRFWRSDPDASEFLLSQGQQAFISSQAYEEAIDWFTLSLALDGEAAESYYWRGQAYMEMGELDNALDDYRSAVDYASGEYYYDLQLMAVAWARQGFVHLEKGDLHEAIDALGQAIILDPEFDDFRIQRGQMQDLLDLMEQAQ